MTLEQSRNAARLRRARKLLVAVPLAVALTLWTAASAYGLGEIVRKPGPAGCISNKAHDGVCQVARAVRSVGEGVAISPDGKSLYATSYHSNQVAIFDRDPATGALRQKPGRAGCISTDESKTCARGRVDDVAGIVVSADGRFVYAAAADDNAILVFARNLTTGALHQLRGAAGCISETETGERCRKAHMLRNPVQVSLSPDGRNLYAADYALGNGISILRRNPRTGALSQARGASGCISRGGKGGCGKAAALKEPSDLKVSPDGKNVYVSSAGFSGKGRGGGIAILDRNPRTGALTQRPRIGCINQDGRGGCRKNPLAGHNNGIVLSGDGRFVYAAAVGSSALLAFARNQSTGALEPLSGKAACFSVDGSGGRCEIDRNLKFDGYPTLSPDGANLYVSAAVSNAISIFDRDVNTGALALKPGAAGCVSRTRSGGACQPSPELSEPAASVVSPDGRSFYVTSLGRAREGAISIFDRQQ
jgi:DNA-binding beta-propeller fold protein YncE